MPYIPCKYQYLCNNKKGNYFMKKSIYYYISLFIFIFTLAACGNKGKLTKREYNDLVKTYKELSKSLENGHVILKDDRVIVSFSENLLFDINKYEIKTTYYPSLTEMARVLNKYPKTNILITGYTDNTGTQKINLELSKKRADAAKEFLINNQVSSYRIYTWGLGDKNPVASNDTEEGRSQNRRVEFVIMYNYNAD